MNSTIGPFFKTQPLPYDSRLYNEPTLPLQFVFEMLASPSIDILYWLIDNLQDDEWMGLSAYIQGMVPSEVFMRLYMSDDNAVWFKLNFPEIQVAGDCQHFKFRTLYFAPSKFQLLGKCADIWVKIPVANNV